MAAAPGEHNPQSGAGSGEQEAFCDELDHDAAARRAQGLTDGEFAAPGNAAGEQHVGDVSAGDQQHQSNDAHKDFERRRESKSKAGKTAGGGSKLDAGVFDVREVVRRGMVAEVFDCRELPEEEIGGSTHLGKRDAGLQSCQ